MALLFFVFFLQAQVGSRSFLLPSCVKLLLSFRGDDGAFIAWPGLANRILAFSNTHTTFAAKAQFMGKESLRRQPAKANTPPASSFLFCYAASPRKSCLKQDIIKCNQTVALAKHWLFDFGFLWKPSSSPPTLFSHFLCHLSKVNVFSCIESIYTTSMCLVSGEVEDECTWTGSFVTVAIW